jgi:hypothetical protein
MDDPDATDRDLVHLVVQLCTRIGMIMEDVSPLAIDASRNGLRRDQRLQTSPLHSARAATRLDDAGDHLGD